MTAPDFKTLHSLYRAELLERVVPFWITHGVDWERGGICTCLNDQGERLSRNKYMWSQLRAIWTFSTLYNCIERKQEWLDIATHIFNFVKKFGRDDQGRWIFLVDENGKPLQGATSIYADGFAIYGFTAYARAGGDPAAIQLARETFANVQNQLAAPGSYLTAPHPIPKGAKAHGISMIFSLAFYELGQYLNDAAMIQAGLDHAEQVMTVFLRPEHKRAFEFVSLDNSLLPIRATNPGHALESMWFMIHIYQQEKNDARIRQAIEAMRWHLELGWDDEYGGLFLARDAQGTSWESKEETKIWWTHTEALYALLLAYSLTHESWCLDWFQRVHGYSFAHFPVPHYGEWIQNLDRYGKKTEITAWLPVKDPFHLSRSLIYSIGVLEKLAQAATIPALA